MPSKATDLGRPTQLDQNTFHFNLSKSSAGQRTNQKRTSSYFVPPLRAPRHQTPSPRAESDRDVAPSSEWAVRSAAACTSKAFARGQLLGFCNPQRAPVFDFRAHSCNSADGNASFPMRRRRLTMSSNELPPASESSLAAGRSTVCNT